MTDVGFMHNNSIWCRISIMHGLTAVHRLFFCANGSGDNNPVRSGHTAVPVAGVATHFGHGSISPVETTQQLEGNHAGAQKYHGAVYRIVVLVVAVRTYLLTLAQLCPRRLHKNGTRRPTGGVVPYTGDNP